MPRPTTTRWQTTGGSSALVFARQMTSSQRSECLERGGGVAPVRVVQAQVVAGRRPRLQHPLELPGVEFGLHILLHKKTEPHAFLHHKSAKHTPELQSQ